ncbi:hypothetical protein H0266_11725 [Halobacillus locisalis]|uniref:Uncharacterized protein n=1 Tax=Halobacillus locisalis TaxID=220753 RepID=A0A838CUI9_9BACI|nr:DUF6470 family protein [Halobacillus locisalis]MBA2175563.1 hypothetical protein [Halobacillus locisalis]
MVEGVAPKLQVSTTQGRIGITKKDAVLHLKQQKADQQIQQPKADLQIRQRSGKLSIDQTKAWDNLKFQSGSEIVSEAAQLGRQDWLEGVARVSREGDELMRIENKGDPIASQAKRNAVWDFDYKPGGRPVNELVDISYQANPADIEVKRNDPIIDSTPRYPQLTYQKGNVDISLAQKPDVQIDWKV